MSNTHSPEQELFELVEKQAYEESTLNSCHIVEVVDNYYRIYHATGYCLRVEIQEFQSVEYHWGADYPGFKSISTIEEALRLVKQWFNK